MSEAKKPEKGTENSGAKNAPKGIRKVNLADLAGQISKRGRESFRDADLEVALMELFESNDENEAFVWDDGFVEPTSDKKSITRLQAKFRNRANSVVKQIAERTNKNYAITVRYTNDGRMVISKRNA